MLHTSRITTISVPPAAVWQLISDFETGALYLAMVNQCTVQGKGVGALRTLTYLDRSVIIERLETVDETNFSLSYSIASDTPFGSCLFSMLLHALYPGQTELIWNVDFQPISFPANEALSLMEALLQDNCQALKQLLEH